MGPPKIEVDDVIDENIDDKYYYIHSLRRAHGELPKGYYLSSGFLQRYNRDRQQPTYPIVTGQSGGYYFEEALGQYK